MLTKIENLQRLVAENKMDRVLQKLQEEIPAYPALQNQLFTLSAKFNDIRKKENTGLLTNAEAMLFRSQLSFSVLELLDEIEKTNRGISSTLAEHNTTTRKRVFISYNHYDAVTANILKEKLKAAKIDVVIDSERMQAGEDIKNFIETCVKETETTISIISKKSLLSAWVAMESINTFYHEKTNANKKFIACFIQDDFFKRDFTDEALDHIESEIKEIQTLITARMEKDRSIRDLQNELTRMTELRNNMDEIIRRIRESLCIDIRDEKLEGNFEKITAAINS